MNRIGTVTTCSKVEVSLITPDPATIRIEDIAHHEARTERYNGASNTFENREDISLSVAQHSLFVAEVLPPRLKLWGLLHDAPEAYTGDAVAPLKRLLGTSEQITDGLVDFLSSRGIDIAAERYEVLQWMKDSMPGFREIEDRLLDAISSRFNLPEYDKAIKAADRAVTAAEMIQVLGWPHLAARQGIQPAKIKYYPRTWQDVKREFLEKFEEYGGVV